VVAAYTTDDLLSRVKARAQMPAADGRLTDADVFAILDDSIRSSVARIVYNADDGRTVKSQADQPITSGVARYRIPDRAVAAGVYGVVLVDSAGNEVSSSYKDTADIWRYQGGYGDGVGWKYDHTIEGDEIVLLPTPSQTDGSLRIKYRRRPSRLVPVSSCAVVSVALANAITTAAAVPSSWGADEILDLIESTPNADTLGDDVAGSGIGGASITVVAGVPAELAAGDFVCLAGETCVPQVPQAAIPFLTVLGAYEVCVTLGDREGAAGLERLVSTRKREAMALIAERSRERQVVINRSSHLRQGGRGYRGSWGS